MSYPIFISYKRKNKDDVFKVKKFLEEQTGIPCWIDLNGIESDDTFVNKIISAIDSCSIFIYFYSKEHLNIQDTTKDWSWRELGYAQEEGKRIVIVNLDRSPLFGKFKFYYREKQQIDAQDKNSLIKLAKDIRLWLDIPQKANYDINNINHNEDNVVELSHSPDSTELSLEISANDAYRRACFYHEGVNQSAENKAKALKYFKLAAQKGHKEAQQILARHYNVDDLSQYIEFATIKEHKESPYNSANSYTDNNLQEHLDIPKSLCFNFKDRKLYMVLSDDAKFYLGNLNAKEDLSWWNNKWVGAGGAAAIIAGAAVFSLVSLPLLILAGCRAIGYFFSDENNKTATTIQASKEICESLSKQTGHIFDIPTTNELKSVKEDARNGCVVLRIADNPDLIKNRG